MKVFIFAALLWIAAADDEVFVRAPTTTRRFNPTVQRQRSFRDSILRGSPPYKTPISTPSSSYTAPSYVERPYAAAYQEPRYYDTKPYQFAYGVDDPKSGTVFSRHEESDGTTTRGHYSVNLPDGCIQTVKYTADDTDGYQADVSYNCQEARSYTPAKSYGYDAPSYQPARTYSYDSPVYQRSAAYQPPAYYQPATVSRQRHDIHQQREVRFVKLDD